MNLNSKAPEVKTESTLVEVITHPRCLDTPPPTTTIKLTIIDLGTVGEAIDPHSNYECFSWPEIASIEALESVPKLVEVRSFGSEVDGLTSI